MAATLLQMKSDELFTVSFITCNCDSLETFHENKRFTRRFCHKTVQLHTFGTSTDRPTATHGEVAELLRQRPHHGGGLD